MTQRSILTRLVSSLRVRLLLLIALTIFPLLTLQLISAAEQRDSISRQVQTDALRLTRLVATNQSEFIDYTRQLLLTLSQLPDVRQGNLAECNALFSEMLQQFPLYSNVYTVTADGMNQCSGVPNEPGTLSVTHLEWFQLARESTGFVLGNYAIGQLTGQAILPSAVPMYDQEGNFLGAVAAGISLAWLNDFLADTSLPTGGILAVTDKTGTILAVYPEEGLQEAVGQNAADNPLFQLVASQGEGVDRYVTDSRTGLLLGFTHLGEGDAGIYIVLIVPESVAFAEVNSVQNRALLLLLVASLAVFTIIAIGSRWLLLQPIQGLIDTTTRLGRGDLTARANARRGINELDTLAASFNTMAAELQRREHELEEANDGLEREIEERRQAEEDLKRFAAQLESSNQELEQFAYVASHDLQEPLRVVAGYLQLIERRYKGRLDSDADEFIAFAVDAAKRMQNLINDLLAYSRIGRKIRPFEPTDMNKVLGDVRRNLGMLIEETGATVESDDLPTIMGDPTQLALVLQNLISNGIKFRGPDAPHIAVHARDCDETWEFSVRDNGIGIDPQYNKRIFLIFQRLHTRDEYPGTGIGLAICQKIVEYHGGKIWVESQEGKGTTFFFTLPKHLEEDAPQEDVKEEA